MVMVGNFTDPSRNLDTCYQTPGVRRGPLSSTRRWAPQTLAALCKLAILLLRLSGFKSIASGLR